MMEGAASLPAEEGPTASSPGGALPRGWMSSDVVDMTWVEDNQVIYNHQRPNDPTVRLFEGIIRRTIKSGAQVTQLIQHGADPSSLRELELRGSEAGTVHAYSPLTLVIDNMTNGGVPSVWAKGGTTDEAPIALSTWPTPEVQEAVMRALIVGGADVNSRGLVDPEDEHTSATSTPIEVAIASGNDMALNLLMGQAGLQLRGRRVMGVPRTLSTDQPTEANEAWLLSTYQRLIDHDSTLAAEEGLLHAAARSGDEFSPAFFNSYVDLLVQHGAQVTWADHRGWTPLHQAAMTGSPRFADSLSRHLKGADVNREEMGAPHQMDRKWTPLALAADCLHGCLPAQDDNDDENPAAFAAEETIRELLKAGADISRLPTATEANNIDFRQLVLPQYTTVLNELPTGAMAAVNAALRPHRGLAAFLIKSLPTLLPHLMEPPHTGTLPANPPAAPPGYGPHEAEAIGWKIAAMCFDQDAASEAISGSIGIRNSTLARRVTAAAQHFVKSAVFEASSSREVVGGTRHLQQGNKRVKVIVPPLQCFAVNGGQHGGHRQLGLREVVHRARLDEAARHGIEEGAIKKGFMGKADCEVGGWPQLGRIDERGQWVSLGIN